MTNSQQKWLDYQISCVMRDQNHCPQPASPREILLQPMALGKVGTINLAESCECVSKHILLAIQTHTPPCAKLHACKYVPSSRAQIEGFLDHPRDSWMALNVGKLTAGQPTLSHFSMPTDPQPSSGVDDSFLGHGELKQYDNLPPPPP